MWVGFANGSYQKEMFVFKQGRRIFCFRVMNYLLCLGYVCTILIENCGERSLNIREKARKTWLGISNVKYRN